MTIPIEEEIARLDTPEAVADRRVRARKMAECMDDKQRWQLIYQAGTAALDAALNPHETVETRGGPVMITSDLVTLERRRRRNLDQLVARECEAHLRLQDERDLYSDPDRVEEQRISSAYLKQVSAVAWSQGNKSEAWVAKWQELVRKRTTAEEYGESTDGLDHQLEKLVGVRYPVLPLAAWETADALPEREREPEWKRLEAKYGPRKPETAARHRGRK